MTELKARTKAHSCRYRYRITLISNSSSRTIEKNDWRLQSNRSLWEVRRESETMRLVVKFLWVASAFAAGASAEAVLERGVEGSEIVEEELFKVEPHIFESKIVEALNNLKELLRNGDPANGIRPLDPFFLAYESFDFVIRDTSLKGFFRDVTFTNFSRFEATNIELKLLPLHFKIDLLLDQFRIEGRYRMAGKILNEIFLNGTGKFISDTQNLTLSLYLRPTKVNSNLQIKDIIFEFKTLSEKVNYTNEFVSEKFRTLDENLVLYVLDQVQEKYVPPLLNTLRLVLNHFLLGYSFQDIIKIIFQFLNKNSDFTATPFPSQISQRPTPPPPKMAALLFTPKPGQ